MSKCRESDNYALQFFFPYHCQYMLGQCDELYQELIQEFQLQTLLQY